MKFQVVTLVLLALCLSSVISQEVIFPGVYGDDLLEQLVDDYKPNSIHGYDLARDRMYGLIDNNDDSVSCVYTGYTVYVPYGDENPRNYTNSYSPIINAEHTWPQSLGAHGTAKSDLHHLFPTNADANSARGNFPFDEISDNLTDKWYRGTSVQTSTPTTLIEEYSELDDNTRWEAREDHKGNVARAMFYFYTMYKDQADAEDPTYFNDQKDALRLWNAMDPPDEDEIERTEAIASFQEGKANPFVLDTSLIGRAYFGVTVDLDREPAQEPTGFILHQNYPNPFNPSTEISFHLPVVSEVTLRIFNVTGELVRELMNGSNAAGTHRAIWDGTNDNGQSVASGIYIYRMDTGGFTQTRKMLLAQ